MSPRRFLVGDPANNRTSFYRATTDSVYYERGVPFSPSPRSGTRSVCVIGDRLFARELRDGWLVHELTEAGEIENSFESADQMSLENFQAAPDLLRTLVNAGMLTCIPDRQLIISASRYLPYVKAYTSEGELVWDTELSDFRPLGFEPASRGGFTYEFDPEGTYIGVSVTQWNRDAVLVQYSVHIEPAPPTDRDFYAIHSRVLSMTTGEELDRNDALPLISDVDENGTYYSFQNLPYPQVHLLRRTEN